MGKALELTGKKFGRLFVVRKIGENNRGNYLWLCRCDCGNETVVVGTNLKSGNTKSCKCLQKYTNIKRSTFHGHRSVNNTTGTYRSWQMMKNRCLNRKDVQWNDYGGRGIKVCKRWVKFENFLKDMGEKSSPEYQIDRINNDGNYYKSNCRWTTCKVNSRNKRNNYFINLKGKQITLAELAEQTGINRSTLKYRIDKLKWPIEKVITRPVRKINHGESM